MEIGRINQLTTSLELKVTPTAENTATVEQRKREREFSSVWDNTIPKVIELVVTELEPHHERPITVYQVRRLLEETINKLESKAIRVPVRQIL